MRKFDKARVVADLAGAYPEVVRLALLLTGREDVARAVARFVMSRAVAAWRTWEDDVERDAWFSHHALLTARRAGQHRPSIEDEALLRNTGRSAEYTAFVRAVRELPFQQAEAWLLGDVLGRDLRKSATAMDLSTTATTNHLEAARRTLKSLTGERYDELLARTREAAASLGAGDPAALPEVRAAVARYQWPRRLKAAVKLLLLAGVVAALWLGRDALRGVLGW